MNADRTEHAKRSRLDTYAHSFRKTGIHFSGKCSSIGASRLAEREPVDRKNGSPQEIA
jgi:hypothetical protein